MPINIDSNENGLVALSSLIEDEIQFLDEEEQLVQLSANNVSFVSSDLVRINTGLLLWDQLGDKMYETGIDRGVLYLSDGSAIPWNGLVSVVETFDKESSPIYYDGMKINDSIVLGDFSAVMKAYTYPEEFVEVEGMVSINNGVFAGDQKPKTFNLCYRTKVGNDVEGIDYGYKLHIIYNLTAIPNEKSYDTLSEDPNITLFEWNITAVPEEIPGLRPTAHFIINSADVHPWFLEDIENLLYNSGSLMPMIDLYTLIRDWALVKIIDNGDGTWTAIEARDGFIEMLGDDLFQIIKVDAEYINETTYILSDTKEDL